MLWTRKQVIKRMTNLYNNRLEAENAAAARLKEIDDALCATQDHCDHEWLAHRDPAGGSDSYKACQVCGKWK